MSWAAQWFDRAGVLGLGWILGWGFGPEERAGRAGLLAGFWVGLGFFSYSFYSISNSIQAKRIQINLNSL